MRKSELTREKQRLLWEVEVVARLLDYAYSEAGATLYNFGTEGESYTVVDGQPVYTDLVLNNPDGMTWEVRLP